MVPGSTHSLSHAQNALLEGSFCQTLISLLLFTIRHSASSLDEEQWIASNGMNTKRFLNGAQCCYSAAIQFMCHLKFKRYILLKRHTSQKDTNTINTQTYDILSCTHTYTRTHVPLLGSRFKNALRSKLFSSHMQNIRNYVELQWFAIVVAHWSWIFGSIKYWRPNERQTPNGIQQYSIYILVIRNGNYVRKCTYINFVLYFSF